MTDDRKDGKSLALKLNQRWEGILDSHEFSDEIHYRFQKMSHRLIPLLDKMFLKTIKACDMIVYCTEQTDALKQLTERNDDHFFHVLTDLENNFEALLKKTYEFRIKAG